MTDLGLEQLKKFKQDIDNLMVSLEIFDRDRIERHESPIHQDTLAKYRLILQEVKELEK